MRVDDLALFCAYENG
jgi:hypothetical protein